MVGENIRVQVKERADIMWGIVYGTLNVKEQVKGFSVTWRNL